MSFKNHTLSASLLMSVIYCSTGIAAPLPAECFESDLDHLVFTHFGFTEQPKTAGTSFTNEAVKKFGEDAVRKRFEEGIGPARRKPIIIGVKEENNSSQGKFYLDASTSKTPSGKIDFTWISNNTNVGNTATLAVGQGSMDTVTLAVFDPVCRIHESKIIKLPKR